MNREDRIAAEKAMRAKFAIDLQAWLDKNEHNTEWLAGELHINPAALTCWLRGVRFPSPRDLAAVLHMAGGELFFPEKRQAKRVNARKQKGR